ncbi:hypothetical protein LCGC14_1439830 [marine sediment metagenome]|uniref:Uncharacterized protein n=1 Tax=marine sediment metagenome TaxID=412755 RepID=A0A0F9MMZ1_9ZZZZ
MDLIDHVVENLNTDFNLQEAKETAAGRKQALLLFLEKNHVGKENAINAWRLAGMFGDNNDRPTRLAIQALRNTGALILSSSHGEFRGYFMANTQEEYEEFRTHNFRSRAMSILVTDRAMVREARKIFGKHVQLDLFGEST